MKRIKNLYNKFHKSDLFLIGLLICIGCLSVSCTDQVDKMKDLQQDNIEGNTNFYLSFNIDLPNNLGTKSYTTKVGGSNEEEQNGVGPENSILGAKIYFCKEDDTVITSVETSENANYGFPNYYLSTNNASDNSYTHKLEIQIDIERLQKLYKYEKTGKEINILMVANNSKQPTYTLTDGDAKDAVNSFGWLNANPLREFNINNSNNPLPLTNYSSFSVSLFKDVDVDVEDLEEFKLAIKQIFTENAQIGGKLYPIKDKVLELERTVARLDFKGNGIGDNEFIYNLGSEGLKLNLYKLQAFNINRTSNIFRQTIKGTTYSAFGVPEEVYHLFRAEKGNEDGYYIWVYSPNWENERTTENYFNVLSQNEDDSFTINDENGNDEQRAFVTIDELTKRSLQDGYYPWRYITENVVPTTEMMMDENLWKYATGVAFSFRILGKDNEPLKIENLKAETLPAGIKISTDADVPEGTITVTMADQTWMNVSPDPTDHCYYLTYYGFIKHNNVDQQAEPSETQEIGENVPGPMKYAIVRNNIYQLSIGTINNLPNPKDPMNLFITIDCVVAPWENRWDDEITLY